MSITSELKDHIPSTIVGALLGMVLVGIAWFFIPREAAAEGFHIVHSMHILLSALATATMYRIHNGGCECDTWKLLGVGYVGSIGICTISDCLIPFLGETLLGLPHAHVHIGFIEHGLIVNSLALLGIVIAYYNTSTKIPHTLHVLLSTGASLFHIAMALGEVVTPFMFGAIALLLFVAVWIPCCLSDIVIPMLCVTKGKLLREHE